MRQAAPYVTGAGQVYPPQEGPAYAVRANPRLRRLALGKIRDRHPGQIAGRASPHFPLSAFIRGFNPIQGTAGQATFAMATAPQGPAVAHMEFITGGRVYPPWRATNATYQEYSALRSSAAK